MQAFYFIFTLSNAMTILKFCDSAMICRISALVQMVGLHALNNPKTDIRGNMKMPTGAKLRFDLNPAYYQEEIDHEAVRR